MPTLKLKEIKNLSNMPDNAMAKMAELGWVGVDTAFTFTRTDNRNRTNIERKLKCMTELTLRAFNHRDEQLDLLAGIADIIDKMSRCASLEGTGIVLSPSLFSDLIDRLEQAGYLSEEEDAKTDPGSS